MFGSIKDFTGDQFTATKWEQADKKTNFARQFIQFVESDFDRAQFSHAFYRRLALTFGHIAHFNQAGFFEEYFTSTDGKVRFLRKTLQHPCWGDPAFTYSDVERALQSWLVQNDVLENYEQRLAQETEAAERVELVRLKNKYEKGTAIRQPGREAG
jgi:hypothetical protein